MSRSEWRHLRRYQLLVSDAEGILHGRRVVLAAALQSRSRRPPGLERNQERQAQTRPDVNQATVNYRTRHKNHYVHFGKEPPPEAKEIKMPRSLAKSSKLSVPSPLYRLENRISSPVTDQPSEEPRQEESGQDTATIEVGMTQSPSLVQGPPAPVSLCMIVRDEEATLATCLHSVAKLVANMIVVDTGSTDRTKEVARQCDAEVFDFPWVDDFAAARNEALRHASGEWILWLDADESFDEKKPALLKRLLGMLRAGKPRLHDEAVFAPSPRRGLRPRCGPCPPVSQAARRGLALSRPRANPSRLREVGDQVVFTDIVLHHTGYQEPRGTTTQADTQLPPIAPGKPRPSGRRIHTV